MKPIKVKKTHLILPIILLLAFSFFCTKYKRWFHNIPEDPYTAPHYQDRITLTFGTYPDSERIVSWRFDSLLTKASLYYTELNSLDTIIVPAKGSIIRTRGGVEARYEAKIKTKSGIQQYSYQLKNDTITSKWHTFKTEPMDSEVHFLYVGDIQDKEPWKWNKQIATLQKRYPSTDFFAFGGDLIERPLDYYWKHLYEHLGATFAQYPIVAITGNHEYLLGLPKILDNRWIHNFVNPHNGPKGFEGTSYCLHFPNLLLVCIDTDGIQGPYSLFQHYSWLKKTLSTSSEKWKIVMQHHPLKAMKPTRSNPFFYLAFTPLFKEYGVQLILQGHDHGYKRNTHQKGHTPLFLISSCSPKSYPIGINTTDDKIGSTLKLYQKIDIKNDTLHLKTYEIETNELYDDVAIIGNRIIDYAIDIPEKLIPDYKTIKKGGEATFRENAITRKTLLEKRNTTRNI